VRVPKRIWIAWVGLGLVLAVALALFILGPRMGRPQPAATPSARTRGPAAESGWPSGATGRPAAAGEEPSRLADGLNSPAGDIRSDLRLIDNIFIAYRSALHTGNPIGENAEITAALKGRNRIGFAFIPANHPAINSKGELCDRWGTPYFFHQLSGQKMEIRSAGPDHRLWTADDVVLTP
jgi:hypothetical protein